MLHNGEMCDEPGYRTDLYAGTASAYDRFRVAYPAAMIDDMVSRVGVSGRGRLLDLACGTGQISFALMGHFAEVLAVDQEPDMVAAVCAKADAIGARNIRAVTAAAENLSDGLSEGLSETLSESLPEGLSESFHVQPESFELVASGNAFHRLDRQTIAADAFRWLQPGGCLALCWASTPWLGDLDWQRAMAAVLERWKARVAAHDRVPPGWERARTQRPDREITTAAGFDVVGTYRFPTAHRWTITDLVGLVHSTSFLSRAVLGELADDFEAALAAELTKLEPAGVFAETIDFTYELARRPL